MDHFNQTCCIDISRTEISKFRNKSELILTTGHTWLIGLNHITLIERFITCITYFVFKLKLICFCQITHTKRTI